MTIFQIKVLAIITMIIDHLGLFFFPQFYVLRIIGRLSFPLFAWLIANGAYRTHNVKKYFYRLLALALLSQYPYLLINNHIQPGFSGLNIFFTLSIGLGAIVLMQKTTMRIHRVLIAAVSAALGQFLYTDYGGFGVLVIIAYYLFYKNWKYMFLAQSGILLALLVYSVLMRNYFAIIEVVSICSLGIIYFYNRKEGRKMKYFFYLFYPVHLVVMYLLLRLI